LHYGRKLKWVNIPVNQVNYVVMLLTQKGRKNGAISPPH
jgi:hypothetical protein